MDRFFLTLIPPVLFFLGILIIFQTFLRRSTKKSEKNKKAFIEEEREASFVRAKDIEQTKFIKPDIEKLNVLKEEEAKTEREIYAYGLQKSVLEKASKPMLHFEQNNLELKKMYGPANLESIILYEENYNSFLNKLNSFSKALADADRKKEAIQILEEGIELGLDFSRSFILLADLYYEQNEIDKLKKLYDLVTKSNNITINKVITYIDNLLKTN